MAASVVTFAESRYLSSSAPPLVALLVLLPKGRSFVPRSPLASKTRRKLLGWLGNFACNSLCISDPVLNDQIRLAQTCSYIPSSPCLVKSFEILCLIHKLQKIY